MQNALKLDTADDIGDRKSNTQNGYLKTTADEIEEEYTLIGLIRMKPFHHLTYPLGGLQAWHILCFAFRINKLMQFQVLILST